MAKLKVNVPVLLVNIFDYYRESVIFFQSKRSNIQPHGNLGPVNGPESRTICHT